MGKVISWLLLFLVLFFIVELSNAQGYYRPTARHKYEDFFDVGRLDYFYNEYGYQDDYLVDSGLYAHGNDNLFFADWNATVVYRIDLTTDPPTKTVFAGILNSPGGDKSDTGQATGARVQKMRLAVNQVRNELYIVNNFNHTMQKVDIASGVISHVAGEGCRYQSSSYYGYGTTIHYCDSWVDRTQNGGPAINAYFNHYVRSIAPSLDGDFIYLAEDRYIRRVNLVSGNMEHVGGNDAWMMDFYQDDIPMSTAELSEVGQMAAGVKSSNENIYFSERIWRDEMDPVTYQWNYWDYYRIRRFDPSANRVYLFMGRDGGANYVPEYYSDDLNNQPASDVVIQSVTSLTAYDGNLYVFTNHMFKVNLDTEIVTIFVEDYEYRSVAWLTNGDGFLRKDRNGFYDDDTTFTNWVNEKKMELVKLSECPAGSVCDSYSPYTVYPCEPGSIQSTDHQCTFCEANTFSEQFGSIQCTVCPAGRVSGVVGSDTVDNCVNPTPNFVIGYLSIGLLLFIVFQYVVNGRFHRIAFIRKFRAMSLMYFEAKSCSHQLSILVEDNKTHDVKQEKHTGIMRYVKVILWVSMTTILIGAMVLLAYVLVMSKVFFQSLLIYKGFNVDNLGFIDKMEELAESLSWVGNLFYPFIWVIEQLSFFKIDLNTVEVTCKGAQAPMELLINCCVLGFAVIIIESDFHLYANSVFGQINIKFVKAGSNFKLGLPNVKDLMLKCLFFYVVAASNPLVKILQFTMSILQFAVFVKDDGRHETTDSCNDPDSVGYEGLDEALATISTLLAYFILFPTLYTVSKVVVPHGDANLISEEHLEAIRALDDKKDDYIYNKKEEDTDDKIQEYDGRVCPDGYQNKLSDHQFKNIVRLFDRFDVDGGGRIEEEEMIDHFFQLGLVSSTEKTREVFEKADTDHSGSIDFNEYLDFMCRIRSEDRVEFNFLMESSGEKVGCIETTKGIAKISTFLSPDVLMASTFMWWLNKLVVALHGRARFNYKDILYCSYKKQTPDEFAEWKDKLTRTLPPYHVLCRLVANAIHGYFCCCDCCGAFSRLLYVVAFFPPVHLCTSVGRSIWYLVYRKYYTYVMACLGIWLDDCVRGYDLDNASKICIGEDVDVSNDKAHSHEEHSEEEILGKLHNMRHADFNANKHGQEIDTDEMGEVIRMILAPRAVLLQVIPQLTPLSIYTEIMADSPLFIPSKKASKFFPELLIRNALKISKIKEMKEANHEITARERGVEWVVRLRSINIYVTESRLFKIVKNLFLFLFSLGVLYSNPEWWISMSMIILFPFLFISLLDVYVMTGKFFGITDDDVSVILPTGYSYVDNDDGSAEGGNSGHVAAVDIISESVDVEIPIVRAAAPTEVDDDGPQAPPPKGQSVDSHLASLATLRKQGIIDDEHFERAKGTLLSSVKND